MVNGILLRPYISGMVWNLSENSMAVLREGIDVYKAIRGEIREMVPFFPLGFGRVNDAQLAYGLRGENRAYLSVFAVQSDAAEIPLKSLNREITGVKVIYPSSVDCAFSLDGNQCLTVRMPKPECARLFEITFKSEE